MIFAVIRVTMDITVIFLSYAVAYNINFPGTGFMSIITAIFRQYPNYILSIIAIYLLCFYFIGMYKPRKGFLVEVDELIGSFISITLAWAILIVLTFLKGEYEYSRAIILYSWPISFILMMIIRAIILRTELYARAMGYGSKRAAIIGSGELAQTVAQKIKDHPSYGINLIGLVGDTGARVLGRVSELESIVKEYNIKALYVADPSFTREKLAELAAFCDEKGLELGTIPDVFQILTTSPAVEDIEGLPIVSLKHTQFTGFNRFLKRAFDIILSLFGLILFAIPMLLITILIRLFSPGGPAIYKQDRVGRGGKVFSLLKFRTMIPDAEASTGPILATGNDPRKTRIGSILRSTNLDELPQLINILKGDMSFVGPRPERPVFVEEFKQIIPKYMERHKIKPGLAGWAQLHGGYHMPAEEKIKYDLYYIENWLFLLDIKIILKYIQIAFTFQRKN